MDDAWRRADTFAKRMTWARKQAGHSKPTDAARALGIRPGTYRTYEAEPDQGGRQPDLEKLDEIARRYGVSWAWLLRGDGTPDPLSPIANFIRELEGIASKVPEDKRMDALAAAAGVLESYIKRAG